MRLLRSSFRPIVPALWVLILVGSPALGQETPTAETAQTETPQPGEAEPTQEAQPPRATVATDVSEKAKATREELQKIRAALDDDTAVVEIEDQLTSTIQAIDASKAAIDSRDLSRISNRQLEGLRLEWINLEKRVDEWLAQVGRRANTRQENLVLLSESREEWVGIRATIVGQEGMQLLVERIDTVLSEIDAVELRTRERLERILTSQERLFDEQAAVASVIDTIDEVTQAARERLLTLDRPPLWVALLGRSEGPSMSERLGEVWKDHARSLRTFLKDDVSGLVLHVVWCIAVLLPTLYLGRRGRDWMSRHPSLHRTSLILDRPFSSALILGSLIARWTYQPTIPRVFLQLLIMAILLPLLRLLMRVTPRPLHMTLRVFGVLFVLNQLQDLSDSAGLVGRLFLLTCTVLSLLGALWIRRASRTTMLESDPWQQRLVSTAAVAAAAIFGASVLANVLGNVGLAGLLANVILTGAYGTVLFYAGYLILEGAVSVVFVSHLTQPLRSVWAHREAIRTWVVRAVQIGLGIWWVWVMLGVLQIRDLVVSRLTSLLTSEWNVGTVTISLGNLLAGIVSLWVAVILSRALRAVLEEDVMARVRMPRGVPATISMMVRYAVITIGVLFAAAVAGLDLTKFAFVVGALGVGIGFGLQNVVNNFVSGLILAFERPIRVGDTVQTATLQGEVRNIGFRSSRVRTWDGAEVIVPNGLLIGGELTNWTLSDRLRRIVLPVSVAYGSDVRRVEALLIEAVRKHEQVLDTPAPVALFQGFGESSLDFSLRYWTADYDNWLTIGSEIAMAVNDALNEAGIEIPFPQRDLRVRSVDPGAGDSLGASRPEPGHPGK